MKSIRYIVPYFGTLPKGFELWLVGCRANPTIEWVLLTDDRTEYDYPANVKVKYCSFNDIKARIENHFEFEAHINSAWHLSLFKPAYGELFAKELEGCDFWGHCDIDLLWGNIRQFITDDILETYDKIGFQGHSLLYRNHPIVNSRYKTEIEGEVSYREVFSGKSRFSFDEDGMDAIYNYLKIPYYKECTFAHLRKYTYSFSLAHVPENEEYKNKCQIFEWNSGKLFRHYIHENRLYTEEFMYVHFFCRPMSYKEKQHNIDSRYLIYPDCVVDYEDKITLSLVKKYGKNNAIKYFAKTFWFNKHKITPKKLIFNIRRFIANGTRR